MKPVKLPENPRILITRLSHIGDCILTIPLANAIRDAFPDAWIGWAIEAPGDQLIRECAAVNQIFKVPKSWLKKPFQSLSLRRMLRQFKFDLTIDPQSLTKSSGIARLAGARWRLGLDRPLGRELAPFLNNVRCQVESRHVVDRTLEMLKTLGISDYRARFDLPVPARSQEIAARIQADVADSGKMVIINPGAGWKSRQWCNKRFGEVAAHIANLDFIPLVTWFGAEEEQMADEIVKASRGKAVKAPATRLWELGALIEQSHFYIGCDTGPTHLAAALSRPCITLFGTTEPEVSGPYEPDPENPMHIRIQSYYQSGSSRTRRKAENDAMMQISAAEVCEAVDEMASRVASRSAA